MKYEMRLTCVNCGVNIVPSLVLTVGVENGTREIHIFTGSGISTPENQLPTLSIYQEAGIYQSRPTSLPLSLAKHELGSISASTS
jgi:hypothetical protein